MAKNIIRKIPPKKLRTKNLGSKKICFSLKNCWILIVYGLGLFSVALSLYVNFLTVLPYSLIWVWVMILALKNLESQHHASIFRSAKAV